MTNSNKHAKSLRKNSTEPEKILWHYLRNRRFLGYKFRRQFPVGNYIVDFICTEFNLVIELDGAEHLESNALEYDRKRTEFLNQRGLKVIRFCNSDIFNNLDCVLEYIRQSIESPSSGFQPPSPLKGEGSETFDKEHNTFAHLKSEDSKFKFRQWAKDVRAKLDMKALSGILAKKLKQTEEYKSAKNIMIFYPLKDEVNLLSLTEDNTKTFYLPKIDGDNLLCCKFDKNTELCESCFHTMEPVIPPLPVSSVLPPQREQILSPSDLIIVPALAVDKQNFRLGYGKGFYDRFLAGFKNRPKTVVCIPKELIAEELPHDEFDISVDFIITQD